MHTLKIHLQAMKGADVVEPGEEGSYLVSHYLILNGKDLMRPRESREEDPTIEYSIVGAAPTGFMYLEIFKPWPELLELFPPEERLDSGEPDMLWLPLRKIEFERYETPPPVTDLEYENAALPFPDRQPAA